MNYTSLISRKKQYKYSVNLHFDIQNEDRLTSFIPNLTTTEIIREYLGGIIRGKSAAHSRILYGSYGTGKSHLLTVLSSVLGHINTNKSGFELFVKAISKYDNELSEDIRLFVSEGNPYLIVPVYSDFDDFGKCITFSLKKALGKTGVDICFNGFFEEAYELVLKWLEGDESRDRLIKECEMQNITLEDLKNGLLTYDETYESKFNSIYSGISYGASFNCSSGNLIDNLNMANEKIRDCYRGIVFIFDEFGRYVEDYGEELKVKTIQDFAEYCDHAGYDNHLILVSHKQLSLYTKRMKKSVSEEWKKVEGRFKSTSINVKYDQCLSLIGSIIPKTKEWDSFKIKYENELTELYNQAWDFKGFLLPPDMEERNPFEEGFPLHPITLFALDRLSKKVAQNERTFFTYLAGDEKYSLVSQLADYNLDEFHFIGLDAIYDYFEDNIRTFKTDEAYAIYKKLQNALNRLGDNSEGKQYEVRVLKALAVINIIGDTDVLAADNYTLVSVIDGNSDDVSKAIAFLEDKRIIKYMRQYGYFDFFESSIFDLESMIEEKMLGINGDMVISILNEQFASFVMHPYKYNEMYHINRVFIPVFAAKEDITKKSFKNALPKYYDGIVLFIMDNQAEVNDYSSLTELPERSLLVINNNSSSIELETKRYIAIQYLYSKRHELAESDPTVVKELGLYLVEQEGIVNRLIQKWRGFEDKNVFTVRENEEVDIWSKSELSDELSKIMIESFDKTPIVNNDLLNKNTLSGAMKQARKKALESIILEDDIYNRCQELSPEYNIIRATISKNGIDGKYKTDNSIKVNHFNNGRVAGKPVMEAITNTLIEDDSKHIAFKELYEILKKQPFGMRDGCIPVVLAYALRKYQYVSLYFHGNERAYTAEELVQAVSQPDDYTLFVCNWTDEQMTYIENLEEIFSKFILKEESQNRLEKLFKAINMHYSSISKSARTTEVYVSESTKLYRNILNLSYKDYNKFFFEILPQINPNLQELVIQIANIVKEFNKVEEKQYAMIKRIIKQVFDISDSESLIESMAALYKNSWKEKSIKAFDYITNGVIDLVSKAADMDEAQFIFKLGEVVTGFEVSYWDDNKIYDFEKTLKEVRNKVYHFTPLNDLSEGEMKVTIESSKGSITSQFNDCDLTMTGQTMLNKMRSTMNNIGAAISYEEKVTIMAKLLDELIG